MIKTMAPPPSSSYAPAPSPHHHRRHHHHVPSAPTISISTMTSSNDQSSSSSSSSSQSNSKLTTVDFSPPLIAMVVVVATAFLVITYSRLISRYLLRVLRRYRMWRRRRRFLHRYLPSSNGDIDSPPALFDSPDGFHVYSPYGLDESVIKTIPLSLYYTTKSNNNNNQNNDNYYFDFDSNNQNYNNNSFHKQTVTANANNKDCAVCLLEFEDNDYVRTLPVCSHAFHVDCIDIWLRSHANCPLCRAGIFRPESPFIPVMAARIRPSFDDSLILHRMSSAALDTILQSPSPITAEATAVTEITPCIDEASPRRNSDDQFFRFNGGRENFLLKRSYSFGFERSSASERMMVMEAATSSPCRYRRGAGGGSFWSKRPSPFGSLSKSRVFSFRHYRGMKSPAFFRRRGSSGLFPLSERFSTAGSGGGSGWGSSSRRSKSIASPMFLRSSVGSGLAVFSSSRLRCGDPEALLSPERFNRR